MHFPTTVDVVYFLQVDRLCETTFTSREESLREEKDVDGKRWRRTTQKKITAITAPVHFERCKFIDTGWHCGLGGRCPDLKAFWKKSWEAAKATFPRKEELLQSVRATVEWAHVPDMQKWPLSTSFTLEQLEVAFLYLQKDSLLLNFWEKQIVALTREQIDNLEKKEKMLLEDLLSWTECSGFNFGFIFEDQIARLRLTLKSLAVLWETVLSPLCSKVKNLKKILKEESFLRISMVEESADLKLLKETFQLLREMNQTIYDFRRCRTNGKRCKCGLSLHIKQLHNIRGSLAKEAADMRKRLCSATREDRTLVVSPLCRARLRLWQKQWSTTVVTVKIWPVHCDFHLDISPEKIFSGIFA